MAEFESFGFYTISADYLEFLNSKDSEVYYNTSYRNAVKPFVGIIIDIIVEVKYNGKTPWGKLKSGAGWIGLYSKYVERL